MPTFLEQLMSGAKKTGGVVKDVATSWPVVGVPDKTPDKRMLLQALNMVQQKKQEKKRESDPAYQVQRDLAEIDKNILAGTATPEMLETKERYKNSQYKTQERTPADDLADKRNNLLLDLSDGNKKIENLSQGEKLLLNVKEKEQPSEQDVLDEQNKTFEARIKRKIQSGKPLDQQEQKYYDSEMKRGGGGSNEPKGRTIGKAREDVVNEVESLSAKAEGNIGKDKKGNEFFKDEPVYNMLKESQTAKADTVQMIDRAESLGYNMFDGADGSFLSDLNKFQRQLTEYRTRAQQYGQKNADEWLNIESNGQYNADDIQYLIRRMTGK